jgi:uncharacterized protein (TIGR02217 family)
MPQFLNERIDLCARYGTSYSESFSVSHYRDIGTSEYSRIYDPYPLLRYELNYSNGNVDELAKKISNLFKKAMGTYRPFRVKHYAEFTTNNKTQTPTPFDQQLIELLNFNYQLVTWYDIPGPESPRRLILKPIVGSVRVAVDGVEVVSGFTINYNNGTIQFLKSPGGVVTGGAEFDIPMRFDDDYSGVFNNLNVISATVVLVEVMKT